MRHRASRARVEDVAQAGRPLAAEVAVVAGGGRGPVRQRQQPVQSTGAVRGFNANPPRRAGRAAAASAQFAAQLDQMTVAAPGVQQPGEAIHRMALGDGGEVHAQFRPAFFQRRRRQAHFQFPVIRPAASGLDRRRFRRRQAFLGAESPQVNQGRRGNVERPIRAAREVQGQSNQAGQLRRYRKPLIGRGIVEPGKQGIGPPMGHLGIHPVEFPRQIIRQGRPAIRPARPGDGIASAHALAIRPMNAGPRPASGQAAQRGDCHPSARPRLAPADGAPPPECPQAACMPAAASAVPIQGHAALKRSECLRPADAPVSVRRIARRCRGPCPGRFPRSPAADTPRRCR